MNVKRFVAADMRRALELVKQEMGDDAIILSSKRTKAGVEIFTTNNVSYEEVRQAVYDSPRPWSETAIQSGLNYVEEDSGIPLHSDDVWGWNNRSGQKHPPERGLASGKTRQQLAHEIEVARRKMEMADRTPFSQQQSHQKDILPSQHYSAERKLTGRADTGPKRIEPHLPNYFDETLLDTPTPAPAASSDQVEAIPNLHSPFNSTEWVWHYPQDLSNYIAYPPHETQESKPEKEEPQVEEPSTKSEDQLLALKDEISDMREMLHIQLERLTKTGELSQSESKAVSLTAAIKATIARRLKQMGLSEDDINALITDTKVRAGLGETWVDVLAVLAHRINIWDRNIVAHGGMYAFVGPSGAGKTSVISKLATRFVLTHPKRRLSIVVLENLSVNQHALTRLGKILDVPVHCVSDRISLTRALADCCEDDLVLVDTPNNNQQFCKNKKDKGVEILESLPNVDKILVLPANAQRKSLQTILNEYKPLQIKACVVTKLDECVSLGEVISIALQSQLPLSYFSQGQSIPEDIEPARAHQLMAKAVALLKQDRSLVEKPPITTTQIQSGRQSLSA